MCGIFAVALQHPATRNVHQLQKFVTMLALASAERGTDATGLAIINDKITTHWHKDALSAYDIVHRKLWKNTVGGIDAGTHFILGHTRRATKGENLRNNSHPFFFTGPYGDLVGVHNGTITNHENLHKGVVTFQVDSANVYRAVADTAPKDWPELLGKLEGSFALMWTQSGVLYYGRNDASPLVSAWSSELQAWVYASTEHMIRVAASYAGLVIDSVIDVSSGSIRGITALNGYITPKPFDVDKYAQYDWVRDGYRGASYRAPLESTRGEKDVVTCAQCYKQFPKSNMFAYGIDRYQCTTCRRLYEGMSAKSATVNTQIACMMRPMSKLEFLSSGAD